MMQAININEFHTVPTCTEGDEEGDEKETRREAGREVRREAGREVRRESRGRGIRGAEMEQVG